MKKYYINNYNTNIIYNSKLDIINIYILDILDTYTIKIDRQFILKNIKIFNNCFDFYNLIILIIENKLKYKKYKKYRKYRKYNINFDSDIEIYKESIDRIILYLYININNELIIPNINFKLNIKLDNIKNFDKINSIIIKDFNIKRDIYIIKILFLIFYIIYFLLYTFYYILFISI